MELELRINGVITSQDIAPNESLLAFLRREGYYSVKHGCETGECGACTVLVDGVPRPSCVMLAVQAGGCTISTAESLGATHNLSPLQQAFVEVGAVQCGFCTSGMLLSAHSLLQQNPSPTEDQVRDALSGNLCRCTGYVKPVQAVLRAAAVLRGEKVPALEHNAIDATSEISAQAGRYATVGVADGKAMQEQSASELKATTKIPVLTADMLSSVVRRLDPQLQVVGEAIPTINATKLVAGKPAFASDMALRGMLYARILTSPYAHALIRNIDVTQARALPGVHAVLTYKDVPRVPYSSVASAQVDVRLRDQYILDSVMRYVGDRVAVVAAETPDVAEQALKLIEVEYEVLPPVLDARHASEPMTPHVHPEPEAQGIYDAMRNIASRVHFDLGDVEQGFAQADLVVEGEYVTPPLQSAPLENHTVTTYFDENDYLVVRTSSSVPHHIRRMLASIFGLPARHIRVEKPEVGGNFGVKQELVIEDLAALLTMVTRLPIQLEYTREDEFRSSRTHQQYIIRVKTGVRRDGTIIANQLMLLADTGAYGTHPLITRSRAASALTLYPCPNMRFAAEVLYTNHAPAGALRGYSLPQEFFALECHIDEVARQLGMDAQVLRRKNWIKTDDTYPLLREHGMGRDVVSLVESCGLPACLRAVEEKLGWDQRHRMVEEGRFRHGVGIALSLHGSPGGQTDTSGAMIKLNEDGSFDVFAGMNDSGNGASTMLAQVAAEVLGVSVEDILIHPSATDVAPFETGVGDSSALYASGGAVKKAAEQMRRQILSVAGRMLNVLPEALKIYRGMVVAPDEQRVSIPQVAQHSLFVENRHIMTTASWKAQYTPTAFAAQGVKVKVDTETGYVQVLTAVTAVDCGNPVNPLIIEAQIQGSVAQALGMGMSEELLYDQNGALLTTNLGDYRIYAAPDMPEMHTYIVETSDPATPFGAKSTSEIGLYALAPAIVNAVADAVGVKMRQLPISPERVLRALHAQMSRKA